MMIDLLCVMISIGNSIGPPKETFLSLLRRERAVLFRIRHRAICIHFLNVKEGRTSLFEGRFFGRADSPVVDAVVRSI